MRSILNRLRLDPGAGAPPAGGGAPPAAPPVAPPTDWRASLPEDIRSSPSLKDLKGVEDLAKGYVNAQRMIGNNVAVPTKDSKPEEWAAFYNKAGRPEAPDKYDFGKIEGEDKVAITPEGKAAYLKVAHDHGLSNRQAAQLYQWYVGSTAKSVGEQQANLAQIQEQATASLKKEWGSAFDQNLDMAKTAVKEFGGEELVKMLEETGLGNDQRVIQTFFKIGRGMAEDKLHSQGKSNTFTMSPAEATAQIGMKLGDPNFLAAYNTREHPGHNAAVEEMARLFKLKNPA